MKNILITISLLCGTVLMAQTPQTVHSITRQSKPIEYYEDQIELWGKQIETPTVTSEAWLNYFMAHYVLYQKTELPKAKLTTLQAQLEAKFPNSFESYYTTYLLDNNSKLLQKAYDKAPERPETYPDLLAHYYQEGKNENVEKICSQWLASKAYDTNVLQWNYNVLVGLAKDAILLTDGDNYTHPLYLLQIGKQVRKDVTVLSLDWLTNKAYRKRVLEALGIPDLVENDKRSIISHLTRHISNRSLYFGVSVPQETMEGYAEELYIIGLAFQYSNQELNNMVLLKDNYENKFLLDYLKISLEPISNPSIIAQMNLKYLPGFLLLHEYYEEQEEWESAQVVKKLSIQIAKAADQEAKLQAYWSSNVTQMPYAVKIPYEEIEKRMRSMDYYYNLYVSEVEVTNADYELFLTDLLKKKAYEPLQQYKVYKTDWRSLLSREAQDLSETIVYQHGHPNDGEHPVQNITHESAIAYCEWLTKGYNSLEEKKKKYKKVRFRLPTEEEWEAIASGRSPHMDSIEKIAARSDKYVWQGRHFKNDRGCYMFNVNTIEEPPCLTCGEDKKHIQDGVFFTSKVEAYFPTEYGVYNILGNVAEMVAEKGIAKGGSWFHKPEESNIYSVNRYDNPSPYIGFRIVMEVLEEKNGTTKKKRGVTPPNTIHLNGKLYMDKSEITNMDWKEYQYWMKTNDSTQYEKTILDTTVWLQLDSNYTPFVKHYHQHQAYQEYPVVGVTYQQAQQYCKWRSMAVNEMLALNPTKGIEKVAYRLPTEQEWEYAASGGRKKKDFPYGIDVSKHKNTPHLLFNYKQQHEDSQMANSTITAPALSYVPNDWGFYNFFGNVAEMVEEEGVSKGGSWYHLVQAGKIEKTIPYQGAQTWLGFRCICELR
jgi:formylglycine-generating enzyme required for sulfatase activity